jgi:hypothetical protein
MTIELLEKSQGSSPFDEIVADAMRFQQQVLAATTGNGWTPQPPPLSAATLRVAELYNASHTTTPTQPPAAVKTAPADSNGDLSKEDQAAEEKRPGQPPKFDLSSIVNWAAAELGAEKPKTPSLDSSFEEIKKFAEDSLIKFGVKQLTKQLNKLAEKGLFDLLSEPVPLGLAQSVVGPGAADMLGKMQGTSDSLLDLILNPSKLWEMAKEKAGEFLDKLPDLGLAEALDFGLKELADLWKVDDSSSLMAQLGKEFVVPYVTGLVKDLMKDILSTSSLTQNFDGIVSQLKARI